MLESMDSHELTEWMAYERVAGPLGPNYTNETLAAIHEQLQVTNKLLGAKFKKNPAPDPRHYPRPHELADEIKKDAETSTDWRGIDI